MTNDLITWYILIFGIPLTFMSGIGYSIFDNRRKSVSSLRSPLSKIIVQGNNDEYARLVKMICELHENEFTEENVPTRESFILELVTDALNASRRNKDIMEIPQDALFRTACETTFQRKRDTMACPCCEAPEASIIGLRYDCGSYFAFSGLIQTKECKRVEKILNDNKKENPSK